MWEICYPYINSTPNSKDRNHQNTSCSNTRFYCRILNPITINRLNMIMDYFWWHLTLLHTELKSIQLKRQTIKSNALKSILRALSFHCNFLDYNLQRIKDNLFSKSQTIYFSRSRETMSNMPMTCLPEISICFKDHIQTCMVWDWHKLRSASFVCPICAGWFHV